MKIYVDTDKFIHTGFLFVAANDFDRSIPNPRRMTRRQVKRSGLAQKVIRCAHCRKAAVRLDCFWPWMTDRNACNLHMNMPDEV